MANSIAYYSIDIYTLDVKEEMPNSSLDPRRPDLAFDLRQE